MAVRRKHKILIKNATILPLGEDNRVLENHTLLIEGDRIKTISPSPRQDERIDEVIDGRGKVLLPGLINAHMHFYSTLVRGLGKASPSRNFNEVLNNLWWRLDKKLTVEESYYSAIFPLLDAIKKGCTTLIDHHASPFAVAGSLDAIAGAVMESGLRASLCYEVSDRDGERIAKEGIAENRKFIERCHHDKNPQLQALFGLHASFTLSDKTLAEASEIGRALGAGFHIHTAEAASDQEACEKEHKMRVVERLMKFGILGPKTICAHGVHLTPAEMELLAKTGTAVVHNPQSNLNNAVGIADVVGMMSRGVLVGLGTDAMTVNMLAELRAGMWAQKYRQNNPSSAFMEMVQTLFWNNAKIADRYWPDLKLGRITEGGAADLILVDYMPPTPLNKETLLGHLVFGIAESTVDTTIASGRVLMQGKQLRLKIKESQLALKAQTLTKRLWERF